MEKFVGLFDLLAGDDLADPEFDFGEVVDGDEGLKIRELKILLFL